MKNVFTTMLLLVSLTAAAQTGIPNPDPVTLETDTDSMSYFLGIMIGFDIKDLQFEADTGLIVKGLRSAYEGAAPYDKATTMDYFTKLRQEMQRKQQSKAQLKARDNFEKGKVFMQEVSARDGVTTTSSGLAYEILEKGSGPQPADTSVVRVHYEGTLMDGTVFDSSYERDEPLVIGLNRVIKGWIEGVQLMPVGSTYRFYIPPQLGYGMLDSGPIPAASVLIFKIELLGIE